ncbi:MAG: glycosyltransferase family A protein [Pseudomonadota bacterium]
MTRLFDLSLDQPDLQAVRFLIQRESLPVNGDLESGFLDTVHDIHRHPSGTGFPTALAQICEQSEIVAVIRNPSLVLDDGLAARVSSAIAGLDSVDDWALAGAGGLGLGDQRHLALYASANPAIPEYAGLQPLLDVMPDLYLVNATYARRILSGQIGEAEAAIELAILVQGYLDGHVSVFVPDLVAAIDGELMSRDLIRVEQELDQLFSDRLCGQSVQTLSGPVQLGEALPIRRSSDIDLSARILGEVRRRAPAISLSIITRTLFGRPHLLRRMLASISRARREDVSLEVILSTDAEPAIAERWFKELQVDFQHLKLRLKINPASGPSRVTNLLGGLQVAAGEYVMFLDDDDYLDLFAFETIRTAGFAGNRPLIVTSSDVHEETWENTPSGRWVLTHSMEMSRYPAAGWRQMFDGVNRLPICGMIIPRARLRARLKLASLNHDLSEDYALFLLVLTDPELPAVYECVESVAHISVRGSENSVMMTDRRPWVRDISGFLADLTRSGAVAGPGQWAVRGSNGQDPVQTQPDEVAELREALARRNQEIRLLRQLLAGLRAQHAPAQERAA